MPRGHDASHTTALSWSSRSLADKIPGWRAAFCGLVLLSHQSRHLLAVGGVHATKANQSLVVAHQPRI